MNFLIYLLLTLVTGFVAGIFRYHPLVILFIAEIIMAAFMLIQVGLAAVFVKLSPQGKIWSVRKGEAGSGTINISNPSPIPISKISIKGFSAYRDGSSRRKIRLSDALDSGELKIAFPIYGEYSGLQNLTLSGISVWDGLGFFFFPKNPRISIPIAVLPSGRSISVEFNQSTLSLINSEQLNINDPTRDRDEFRQLRDYAQGDPWRDVDWHKSAKADKLVVREYDREAETFIDIRLDGKGYRAAGTKALDGFYEIVSAVILGVRETGAIPRVNWVEGGGHLVNTAIIRADSDMESFFLKLFQGEIYDPDFSGNQDVPKANVPTALLYISVNLELRDRHRLIRKFSLQDMEEEVSTLRIIL